MVMSSNDVELTDNDHFINSMRSGFYSCENADRDTAFVSPKDHSIEMLKTMVECMNVLEVNLSLDFVIVDNVEMRDRHTDIIIASRNTDGAWTMNPKWYEEFENIA
jgi:hypothetical protein